MSLVPSIMALFTSFIPGSRLIDGGDMLALANLEFSVKTGIVALAGGGQAGAAPLPAAMNRVDTAGAGGTDSVMLPQAIPGSSVKIYDNTANNIQIFGQPTNPVTGVGDTIAPATTNAQAATATGVSQAAASICFYDCYQAGQWKQGLVQ